jgi:hypothetical protein
MGRRKDIHTPEFFDRRCARRGLRPLERPQLDDGKLLRRQPCCDRYDRPFVLSVRQARHGQLAAVGCCGCLLPRNDGSRRGGGVRRPVFSASSVTARGFAREHAGFVARRRPLRNRHGKGAKGESRAALFRWSKRSTALRRDRGHWVNRTPNPPADMGTGARAKVASESDNSERRLMRIVVEIPEPHGRTERHARGYVVSALGPVVK